MAYIRFMSERKALIKYKMLVIRMSIFFSVLYLGGCGRDNSASIQNASDNPLVLELSLNDVKQDPTKYFLEDALNGALKSSKGEHGANNYLLAFDSLNNVLSLKLEAGERLQLGTLRLDKSRDSIEDWEFHSIKAKGEYLFIKADGAAILNYVEKESSLFRQTNYALILK
ncbi:MAG: hypothetical protein NXI09_05450 [Bacteroidetes bacterium]|nr:hypothetical protein [Bacteroidota bacterium]